MKLCKNYNSIYPSIILELTNPNIFSSIFLFLPFSIVSSYGAKIVCHLKIITYVDMLLFLILNYFSPILCSMINYTKAPDCISAKGSWSSTLLEEELVLDSHLCSWRDFLWILERNLSLVSPSTRLHKCPQPLLNLTMQSFTPTQLLSIVIVPFWLITRLSMILQGLNISICIF